MKPVFGKEFTAVLRSLRRTRIGCGFTSENIAYSVPENSRLDLRNRFPAERGGVEMGREMKGEEVRRGGN